MNTAKRQFVFAVEQASITGTLLGLFLTKSHFADNRAVTLIGFSLGGVVTFNCLKIMKRLYDYD
jgi:surfactin synthase thioesterase subunit